MASTMASPASINPTTISNAITSLLKWRETTSKSKLIPNDDFLYLYITLTKIPPSPRATNPHKLPLPHALFTQSNSDICLIFDDRPNSTLTKSTLKARIAAEGLPVSKVIRLSKLLTDYKAFEAKRNLCGSYDLFLVDRRVVHFLPRALGKEFFRKRKVPVPVDLGKKDLGSVIGKVCKSGLLYFGNGSCCVVKVGRVGAEFGVDELVENVVSAIEGIVGVVPKGWKGVRSLSLKVDGSVALPVYRVVPDVRLRIDGVRVVEGSVDGDVVEEESEMVEGKKKGKRKGSINEVRYMDHNDGEVFDEDELDSDFEEGYDFEEIDDDEEFDANVTEDEFLEDGASDEEDEGSVGEKRKNVRVVVSEEDPAKKKSKVKSEDGVEKKKKKAVKKDDSLVKKKNVTFSGGDEESGKKGKKRKSVVGKPKGGEIKLKAKKGKRAAK